MRYLLILFLLTFQIHLFAQDEAIQQLQLQLEESSGMPAIKIANQLYEILYRNGKYEEASQVAAGANKVATQMGNQEYIAIALNREAKALVLIEDDPIENQKLAIKRLRESQKILRKNGINNDRLANSNKKLLKETAGTLGLKDDFAKAQEIIGMVWDSAKMELAELENMPFIAEIVKEESGQVDQQKGNNSTSSQVRRAKKRNEFINRILEMNKKDFEKEMKKVSEMEISDPMEVESSNFKSVQGMEYFDQVWVVEEEKIKKKMADEEEKIKKLDAEEAKEELLLAHYKSKSDSLAYLRAMDSLNLAKQETELKQQQSELERQKAKRSLSLMGSGGSLLLFFILLGFYFRQKKNNKLLSEKNKQIQEEQNRSEDLLLNILPAEVAGELKQYGAAQAHKFDNVSVLFTDFENFSKIAEKLSPEKLVSELDYCFKAFDNIIEKYNLEKIKTIGDAYMCAGGLPTPDLENAKQAVLAALEIQEFLAQWKIYKIENNEPYFEARIGIHTGPIVAGVVGIKKFAYDIWGDTVNIASRMESGGKPGRINISGVTYELVKDSFECTHRGKINAKNKGDIDMYFVEKIKTDVPVLEYAG